MHTLWSAWEDHRRASMAADELSPGLFGWWSLYRLQEKRLISVFMGPGQKEYVSMTGEGAEYSAAQEMLQSIQEAKEKVLGLKDTANA